MEQQIIEMIEEEVNRRVALRTSKILEVIAKLYEIPLEQLVHDTADCEARFCKGALKNKRRCLKEPQENGYCKFHQSQVPVMKVQTVPVSNAWVPNAPTSRLNI
jgi:Family of unknown function (DUF5763)